MEKQIYTEQVESKQKNNRGGQLRGIEIDIQRGIEQGDQRQDSCEVEGRGSKTLESFVCDSESRRKVQEDPRLQSGNQGDRIITFQNRRYLGNNGSHSNGRFRNQIRSRRCLSPYQSGRKIEQVLRVQVRRARLRVHGPSIWLGSQLSNNLKNVENSNQCYSGTSGREIGSVHGRFAPARKRQQGFRRRYCKNSLNSRGFGMEGGKTQALDDSQKEFRIHKMELGDDEVGVKSS
ncbi:MAG: hypothetical protein EZS28_030591, partial [Streblomastix strix]